MSKSFSSAVLAVWSIFLYTFFSSENVFAQAATCGNPQAQVNFVPYAGIPAADQNSSTNAWDSITLGNKAVIPGGTFFDITDGTNPIDDGTIVSTGLQNFAVSRHDGYIEFLALGRRLTTYYGYYQGTIKFENVQVDRVEWGLTTATWADIGLEASEGDTVTKVSDTEVSFKLAFHNYGDGFRVYLKNPTPTMCTCPAGQEKEPDPKSPVCIVRALVKGVQDTEFILTGYNHLIGNCTLAAGTPQAPQTPSTEITVTAGQQRTSWMQWSPWTFQLDPLLTCPAGTTKTACMFTYGAGPLGEITCGCYPDANTNTPKNLSCKIFANPRVHDKPVHSQSGSPEQFCREQGYTHSVTNINASNFIGNLSKWNGSVWEINPDGLVMDSVSCCKLEDKTSDTCVASGCAEGQYWCQAENICKLAGQTCNATTCNTNTPVKWTQFNNPSAANINNPSAASLGSATGSIQLGSKNIQVSYTGDVRSVGIADNWSWVWTGNTAPFLSTLVPNIPDHTNLLWVFGWSQAMNMLTFSEPVTDPILLFYSIGTGGVNITYEFDRPFTIVSWSTGMAGMGDFVNPSWNILRGAEGHGVIQFHGTFSTLSFKVPTAEYWSAFTVGLKEAATCPVSVTCNNNNTCDAGESCNCGDCTNGGVDDKDQCGLDTNGVQMVCTKDVNNSTTPWAFNSVTAQENFNIVNNKLATKLSQFWNANISAGEFSPVDTELKMTQNDWKDAAGNFIFFTSFTKEEAWTRVKELLSIPTSARVLWSTSSIKYENDALGDNERYLYSYVIEQSSGVQKQIFFATEFLPGYGWRKIYFVSKDYPLSTTTTGAEVCQNFINPTLFWKPLALGSPDVGSSWIAPFCLEQWFRGNSTAVNTSFLTGWLTLWKATGTGWEPNQNGEKIDEIRCCGIPTNATGNAIQVGACCPAGKQWSSTANQCVAKAVDKCLEGQYYCHSELKCKPAGATCGTVTCNNNNVCDTNESCDCADCNEKVDHCGISGSGEQMICTKDTAPTTTSSTEPQLWACCPPGSAWNSVENRCVPTTCGEGQFYCAAQKKCLAGGTTCDTTVCNNDGVCSGEESCQCGDCVNGGGDDKDKCSIVGGVQAMCSDDNLADGKPGACCIPPKKWNSTTNTCVECSNTQAPSELKAGIDEPYITCTGNGDTTKTHFRYRITKQWVTEPPFISEMYTVGTQILHPTMTLGDYTVECFYGNATGVDASAVATPHSCVKTMSVKSDAQGCSRVYPYKGSTLSDEMTSTNAFEASFRCGSRKPVVGAVTNPYMFRIGIQATSYLAFDSLISELFNGLTIGPVSTQTQNYDFNTGTTDVTCATKVGGGYSTNNACQIRTCVGGACNVPQTFSVVHSDDLICTTEDTSTYNIGCNPAAPDSVRNQCIQWFRDAVNVGSRTVANGVEFNVSFIFNNNTPTNVTCIKYVAGQMPGGLNLSDNVVCQATLNNGERYQIYAADTNGRIDALQTTAKTVERDREAPTMAEIKYYTDETLTTEVPSTNWYNKPVIALAVCSDTPLNEATSCACAQTVDASTTDAAFWSVGTPNSLIWADLMRYTRTITESTVGAQKVQVIDTAWNTSSPKNITVSLDTQVPVVTPTESGTGAIKTITLTASDTGSKIWKATTAPSGATNASGIIYRVGPKDDMATLAFDADCNTTATYATVTETQSASFPSQAVATISNVNTVTHVVAYCVRDNAGNTTRGLYPVLTNACFSASNMATIPTFDTYKTLLKTRLTATGNDNQKYGYSFSENPTDASCFRGILSANITTLMTNQLKPRTSTTLSNWDRDRAELSTSTTLSNGYYYYVYPTGNTLDIVTSPSGGAPVKSVVVEGGDIRIKTDINYSGAGKTLVLIARKNNNGQGGNIIIDTNVKRIDAILIADGGALRSSDATLPGERLTINGRVYSYNTRGGSLSVSGVDFIDAAIPKRFTNNSLVNASSLNDARIQDLERFRPMFADGNNTCSLTVNYTAFTTANLPALLKRPNTFTGGSCGF